MKSCSLFLLLVLLFSPGCELQKREQNLQEKKELLDQREKELLLKESALHAKEEELLKREKLLDSTLRTDSLMVIDSTLIGNWSVRMVCTSTTCTGSAVGDTRNEEWNISFENNSIIARAMADNKLIRIYSGMYTGNTLELISDVEHTSLQPATRMVVRLRIVKEKSMEGQREIIRENDCKIIYDLKMEKL